MSDMPSGRPTTGGRPAQKDEEAIGTRRFGRKNGTRPQRKKVNFRSTFIEARQVSHANARIALIGNACKRVSAHADWGNRNAASHRRPARR